MSTIEERLEGHFGQQDNTIEAKLENLENQKHEMNKGEAKVSLNNAVKQKPQESSQVLDFARENKLPVAFVKRNKDYLFEQAKKDKVDIDSVAKNSPATLDHIKDPDKAAVSQNEINELSTFEQKIKAVTDNQVKKKRTKSYIDDLQNAFSSSYYMVNAGLAAEEALNGVIDAPTMASNIATMVRKQREKDAQEPQYVKAALKEYSKEKEEFFESFDKFTENIQDKTFSKILDEGTATAGEAFDIITSAFRNAKGVSYASTKSLATFLPATIGGVGGAAVGAGAGLLMPALAPHFIKTGALTGSILASTKSEAGIDFLGELEARGIDTGDEAQLIKALTNKTLMNELRMPSYRKGFGTATVDVVSTAAGAKLMAGAFKGGTLLSRIGKVAAGQAVETVGEGASELGGLLLKHKGDMSKVSPDEVLDEMYFSALNPIAILGGGIQVAGGAINTAKQKIEDKSRTQADDSKETETIRVEGQDVELAPEQDRVMYNENPTKAMGEVANDIEKSNQAMQDARNLMGMFNQLKQINDTKKVKGLLKEFADKASLKDGVQGKVYFDTDDYDNFFSDNDMDKNEALSELSQEAKDSYSEAKANGTDFEMSLGDFAEHILSNDKMKNLINFTRVKQDGMSLANAYEFRKKAPSLIQTIAKEGEAQAEKKKVELSNETKIKKGIEAKIRAMGFGAEQGKYVSEIYSSLIDLSSKILGEKQEDFYKKFSLSFNKESIKRESRAKIIERVKQSEKANISKHLEGVPEKVAQQLLKYENVTAKLIKQLQDQDAKLTEDVQSAVARIKSKDKKFGGNKKPLDHDKLPSKELQVIADEMVGLMIEDMKGEVERAEKGSAILVDRKDGKKERIATPSTYPKDYRNLKVGKANNFFEAIEKFKKTGKKNALYKRIEAAAKNRLINGYESQESGHLMPDNTYRTTVGMKPLDEKGNEVDVDFTLFDNPKAPRGQVKILGRKFDMSIFDKGDINTLLHETGHVWLEIVRVTMEELSQKESLNESQANYIQEANAMLEYLGVNSFDEITVEHHEKFAETAHAYFGSGKAPTSVLEQAFVRFRTWVVSFFRKVQNIGIEINPEIERFMGALLAAKEETQEAYFELSSPDAYQQAIILGMNEKEAREYITATLQAKLAAEEIATAEYAYKERKKQLAEQNKFRKAIREEVTAEFDNDPRYQAIESLRGKDAKVKLDKKEIVSKYGKEALTGLVGMYSVEGGVSAEVIASTFGFENGKEFLDAVHGLPKKAEAIKAETEKRLEIMFPDILMDEDQLEAIAAEAVLNEQKAKVLKIEIEHLMRNNPKEVKGLIKKLTKPLKTSKEIKAEAKSNIQSTPAKDIQPHKYQAAVRKFAKLAGKAMADGNLDKVIEYKQAELMNLEMYREAKKAKDYIVKSAKKFKKLAKVDPKKKDIDFINGARVILEKHEAGVYDADKLNSELETLRKRDREKFNKVKAIIDSLDLQATPLNELNYDEYFEVAESVFALEELARQEKLYEFEGKMVNKEQIIEDLQATLDMHMDDNTYIGKIQESKTKGDEMKRGFLSIVASGKRVEGWADLMDLGNKATGSFTKYIFRPVSEALDNFRVKKTQYLKRYKALAEKYQQEKGVFPEGSIDAQEIGFRFNNFQDLLGALFHIGNDSNKRKLLLGYGWGTENADGTLNSTQFDAFIMRMMDKGIITKADMDLVQGIWDLMEDLKPDAQKAHKKLEGKYFHEIEANEVVTPFGTYRGGYAPAKIESFFNEDQKIREEKEAFESQENAFMWPSTGKGFTHTRTEAAYALKLDANLFGAHLDSVLRYTYVQPSIQEVAKIVNDKGFRDMLKVVDPVAGSELLNPWLQRAASQRVEMQSTTSAGRALNWASRVLRTNSGMATMFLNVVNTLEQFTGLSIATIKVKPKYLRGAIVSYIKNKEGVTQMIDEKSDFMKERVGSQMIAINSRVREIMLNPSKMEKGKNWVKEHGYFMQEATQNIVDHITWLGAYDEAVAKGVDEKTAIRLANATVRETQGSFNPEDISKLEVGTAFHRLFTMFYSYFNMQANLVGNEFAKVMKKQGLKEGAGRLLYVYAMGIMLPNFLSDLLRKAAAGKLDEDDDEQYLDDLLGSFFGSQLRGVLALVPASSVPQNIINQFDDKWYNDDITLSPAISAVGNSMKTFKHIANALDEDKEVNDKAAMRDFLTAISLFSGVPVAPAYKPYKYLRDIQEGNANPTNPLDFTRGIITGKSGQ